MAWNPTPEVAAVRDAANKLEAPFAVLVCVTKHGQLAAISYGKNRALCDQAGRFAEYLLEAAKRWGMSDDNLKLEISDFKT